MRDQNKELYKVIGIDTLSIGLINNFYNHITHKDTNNLIHQYEISFLTENFESLNRTSKETLLSFLFSNNFSVHFLGNNFSSSMYHNGFGLMIFAISQIQNKSNYILKIDIMKSSRGGVGYECNLEENGNNFTIKDINLRYLY